jgi:hypothetical protein
VTVASPSPTTLGRSTLRPPSVPWRPGDATRLFLFNALGGFVLLLGWVGISGTARLSHQFAWLSLAIVGFLAAGVGNGIWLLSGRRTIGRRMQTLLDLDALGENVGSVPPVSTARVRPVDPMVFVAPDAATRFHRADCMLVRSKQVHEGGRDEHRRNGLVACEICQP